MRQLTLRLLATITCLVFFFQVVLAVPVKVSDGTMVQVKLLQTLTSGKVNEGTIVRYVVIRDVIVGGQLVIEKGARATGKVTVSKHRGIFGQNGKLEFTIESAEAVDGSLVQLRADAEGGIWRSNVTGVILGALFLSVLMVFVNGRDITVKEGTEFPAYIDGNPLVEPSVIQSPVVTNLIPNAKFTVLGTTLTDKAVIGEIRNEGPDTASADIIILIKKDGKQVGAGHTVVADLKAGQTIAFNADVSGSTDGDISTQITLKASTIPSPITIIPQPAPSQVENIAILSMVISDKEIIGKLLNNRKDKVDILVSATCKDGDKIVGTGSMLLKAVAPGETKDYLINIDGKTTSDVTVEAMPK